MEPIEVATSHDQAMDLAEAAMVLSRRGDVAGAKGKYREAFLLERAAADGVADLKELEPTRSVLHRSAATLALDCGDFPEAIRLANRGLQGNPPGEIAGEIREVLDRASKGAS